MDIKVLVCPAARATISQPRVGARVMNDQTFCDLAIREITEYLTKCGMTDSCLLIHIKLTHEVEVGVMSITNYRKHRLSEIFASQPPTETELEGVTHIIMSVRIKAGPVRNANPPDVHSFVAD